MGAGSDTYRGPLRASSRRTGGRAVADWTSSRYRTALYALITWKTKSVASYASVGTTHVYSKSTGKLEAQKTASATGIYAKRLGAGSYWVDVRMVSHASNPFCGQVTGAIDGAFTIHVTQTGNWSITSGSHRQMPNHHVYIYNWGGATDVYSRNYLGADCLVGGACQLANMTGLYGRFG